MSGSRPKGHDGDWWKLEPTTNKLLLRMVSSDWDGEEDPTISIERLDVPPTRPRPPASELEQRLRNLPGAIDFIGLLFVDHVEALRREGYVNQLKVFDLSKMGGLATQFYYEGAYDLRDDEALIIDATVPGKCLYRSLILTNEIYETTDWYNNHSSLNDAQAKPDADGVLRIVVSAKDPGVPNWLDTAGYPRGIIQGRWAECDSATDPLGAQARSGGRCAPICRPKRPPSRRKNAQTSSVIAWRRSSNAHSGRLEGTKMGALAFAFTKLTVADLDAAEVFYGGVLGMQTMHGGHHRQRRIRLG